jgi:TRAP-type transport system periplasmic protein
MLKKTMITAVLVSLAAGVSAKEFKYSAWTPPPAPNNRFGTVPMFEMIEKETKGTKDELTFRNFMGGQLFNAFTTLAGIRDGAVDAGITVPVYNAAELKAHVTFADLQALTRDGYSAAAAGTETLLLLCPECLADYSKNNALSLGVYASAPYYLMCNFDVKSMDNLRGKKSAEGNAAFARWAAAIGMSRIQLPPSEYLQALQRGTTDCIFGPKDWLNAFSLKDVVKTIIEDTHHGVFPAVSMMTVNRRAWTGLSDGQRKVFLKHMPDAIMRVVHGYYVDEKRGEDDARTKGAKFIRLGTPYLKAWGDFKAKEQANVVEAAKKRGVTSAETIAKANLEAMKKWEAIVDKVGRNPEKIAAEMRQQVFEKVKF